MVVSNWAALVINKACPVFLFSSKLSIPKIAQLTLSYPKQP